jgi:hypothetical protein
VVSYRWEAVLWAGRGRKYGCCSSKSLTKEVNDERQVADAGSLRDAGGGSGAEHSGLDVSHASIRGIMRQRLYAWHESV